MTEVHLHWGLRLNFNNKKKTKKTPEHTWTHKTVYTVGTQTPHTEHCDEEMLHSLCFSYYVTIKRVYGQFKAAVRDGRKSQTEQ